MVMSKQQQTYKPCNKDKTKESQVQHKGSYENFPGDPNYHGADFGEGTRPRTLLLKSISQQDIEKGDLGGGPNNMGVQTPVETCSRLSKTLQEILHDREALPYFIQFMESKRVGPYVRFWLDAESFQASSWTRVRSRSQISLSKSSLQSTSANKLPENDKDNNTESTPNLSSVSDTRLKSDSFSRVESTSDGPSAVQERLSNTTTASPQHLNTKSVNESHCDNDKCGQDSRHSCSDKTSDHVNNSCQVSSQSNNSTGSSLSENSIIINNATACIRNNSAHGGSSSNYMATAPITASPCNASSTSATHQSYSALKVNKMHNESPNTLQQGQAEVQADASSQHIKPECSSESNVQACETGSNLNNSSSGIVSAKNTDIDVQGDNARDTSSIVVNDTSVPCSSVSDIVEGDQVSSTSKQASNIQDKLLQSIAKDAVSIFSKYIAKDATHPIGVTEELRAEAIHKICREDGHVDPQCFSRCQDFVVNIMEEKYHGDFIVSDFHCKHQIDLLTSSKVHLADMLYNDTAFSYLMEYMEQEGAMPLLQCWLELDNFQQLLVNRQGQYDGMEAQTDAMVIYDKYFSLQATQPLGFNDAIRFEVEANICREEGPLPDCFVKAKRIVITALNQDYFPGFTKSAIFYKYLQDLINSVQTADIPTVTRKRKTTDNDSGSEHSFGSQSTHSEGGGALGSGRNTLLATGITKALEKMDDNMQIDNALLNPDILWKRPQSGKMSLGKIDELGNYVSEIENEPEGLDKKQLGFFKKKKEKQKSQEEMAAQIAQMIIKDCTIGAEKPN